MPDELVQRLEERAEALAQATAVLMPDLYVDHLVPLEARRALDRAVDRLVGQRGGNALTGAQALQLGGNAANTVLALATLGVPTTLIARTDEVGRFLFQQATRGLPAEPHGLLEAKRPSTTVALELSEEDANVMLSDPGPLSSFGPGDLDEDAWARIEAADVVAVTNWSQTLAHGTELLEAVLPRARAAGAFTFLDTADPAHRGKDVDALLASQAVRDELSAWGMNEHEARYLAGRLLDRDPASLPLDEAAAALSGHLNGRIDVHTASEVMSLEGGELVRVPGFPATPTQRTGAGDAWNAGNLAGTLLELPPEQRLTLANAVAVLTITGTEPRPPSLDDVVAFLARR